MLFYILSAPDENMDNNQEQELFPLGGDDYGDHCVLSKTEF